MFTYIVEAVSRYKELFGSRENIFVADLFEHMANLYGRQKRFDKAFVLLESTLQTRINIHGIHHAKVGQVLFSLGVLFDQTRDFKAAINSFTDCLEIQEKTLGSDSLIYAETLAAIGQCLGNQGDFESALDIWNDVISIYSKYGYDSNHPKIIAIKRLQSLAIELGNKLETCYNRLPSG